MDNNKPVITVKAVPSVQYGKFSYTFKPLNALGLQALAAVKQAKGYTAAKNGKERTTFTQDWINYLFTVNPELKVQVSECDTFPVLRVGDYIKPTVEMVSSQVDFGFMA